MPCPDIYYQPFDERSHLRHGLKISCEIFDEYQTSFEVYRLVNVLEVVGEQTFAERTSRETAVVSELEDRVQHVVREFREVIDSRGLSEITNSSSACAL